MDKKKIIIVAVVLLLGLGTFVFANPDDDLDTGKINDGDTYYGVDDDDTSLKKKDKIKDDSLVSKDKLIDGDTSKDDTVQTMTPNSVISSINQYFTGNSSSNTNGGGNKINNNTGGNSGDIGGTGSFDDEKKDDNSQGNNGEVNNPGTTDTPVNPPIKDEEKEDLSEITNVVNTLKDMVLNATSRDDIIEAMNYRDKKEILKSIKGIKNEVERKKLQDTLNEASKVLDDNLEPKINGIKNLEITNKDVSLSIVEDNLREVLLNDVIVTDNLDRLQQLVDENVYTVIVRDKAFNETKVIFTIDKTAPLLEVSYSDKGQLTSGTVTVYIKGNEALQAIEGWKLASDKKSMSKVFSENTKGVQSLEVKDEAGNVSVASYEVNNIRNSKPTVDEKDIVYSTKELTNGNVEVKIRVSKPVFTPNGWTQSDGYTVFTKVFTENGEEKVLLRDILGNTNVVHIVIDNIDRVKPLATVSYSIDQNIKTNGGVDVIVKANEKLKKPGNQSWMLLEDGVSLKKTFTENTQVDEIVEIEDLAGNKNNISVKVSNIDKSCDGIVVRTSNNDASTNKDVTVFITSPKVMRQVPGWVLSDDGLTLTKIFSKKVKDIVEVEMIDGSKYAVMYEVKNIDKTVPTVNSGDIKYERMNDGTILVTIKVSKPVFSPGEGWQASEGYTLYTKRYTTDVDEVICLRDIYGNTNNVYLKANLQAIDEINYFVGENTNLFSGMIRIFE